jgi:hypothetical protein
MLLTALSLSLALAASQDQAVQDQGTQLPEVVVEARRLDIEVVREEATRFVEEVADPPRGGQIARWNSRVCVGLANMRDPFGQLIVDRIASHALDLGVDVGEPGCRPNVMIVATSDGRATADHLVESAGRSFRPTDGGSNPSRARLEAFRTSDAPVRWWPIALPVDRETGDLAMRPRGGMGRGDGGGVPDAPVININAGSRLTSDIRYDLQGVIIVVDMTRTGAVSLAGLADYVAMVTLAQIDPDADLAGTDTILNVFNDADQSQSLSEWDRSYLRAVYSGQANRASASQRENEVIQGVVDSQMTNAVSPGP